MRWKTNARVEDAPELKEFDIVARLRRADVLCLTDPDVSHPATLFVAAPAATFNR